MEHIIEKLVFLIPEPNPLLSYVVHGCSDSQEMLEKFERNIFIDRISERKFQRNGHHVQAEHAHPASAITLFDIATCRQRGTALKDVLALRVLAVDPPCKVEQ